MSDRAKIEETAVVTESLHVRARLLQLGLTLELLEEAIVAWFRAAAGTSPFEPATAPGSKGWFASTGVIRESKVTDGWRAKNIRNWPIVVDPKTQIAITSTSGDNLTGLVLGSAQPSTKNRKGIVVWDAVRRVNEQALLPGFEPAKQSRPDRVKKKEKPSFITWFLLVFVTPEGARAELSLPAAISGKKIVRWRERLILPEYTHMSDDGAKLGNDDEHELSVPIDVPVERKA